MPDDSTPLARGFNAAAKRAAGSRHVAASLWGNVAVFVEIVSTVVSAQPLAFGWRTDVSVPQVPRAIAVADLNGFCPYNGSRSVARQPFSGVRFSSESVPPWASAI